MKQKLRRIQKIRKKRINRGRKPTVSFPQVTDYRWKSSALMSGNCGESGKGAATMAKNLAQMNHNERMAAVLRESLPAKRVSIADEILGLVKDEMQHILSVRNTAAQRLGDAAPPVPILAATSEPTAEAAARTGTSRTLTELIEKYKSDPKSPFAKVRYATKRFYRILTDRLRDEYGTTKLSDINGSELQCWHDLWRKGTGTEDKIAIAHSMIGMLRGLFTYGATLLDDSDCLRLNQLTRSMQFEIPRARTEQMTAEHMQKICAKAHEKGHHSLALAQAIQFELSLRQKDVIGEWVPESEPGESDVRDLGSKWLRGLRWEEIDDDWILRHVTSNSQEELELDLKKAPTVMKELARFTPRPTSGPVIIKERSNLPYRAADYRYIWRKIATEADVPKTVKNMDSGAEGKSQNRVAPRYRTGPIREDVETENDRADESDLLSTARH